MCASSFWKWIHHICCLLQTVLILNVNHAEIIRGPLKPPFTALSAQIVFVPVVKTTTKRFSGSIQFWTKVKNGAGYPLIQNYRDLFRPKTARIVQDVDVSIPDRKIQTNTAWTTESFAVQSVLKTTGTEILLICSSCLLLHSILC